MKIILAIDDQNDNLISIKGFLNNFLPDCKLFLADSGKEGIAIAKKEQPDIILLDIIMPEMDGFEVCKALKKDERTKFIPILMLSVLGQDQESRVKGLELGVDAFLAKPFIPMELKAQIKVMLRIKEAEDILRKEKDVLEEMVSERTREFVESERRISTLINNLQGIAYRCKNDKNWTMEFISEGIIEIAGYTPEDIIDNKKLSFNDLIIPEDRDRVWKDIQLAVKKRESYEINYRIKTASGELRYMLEKGSGVFAGDTGEFLALEGFVNDITNSKLAEEAIKQSEKDYRDLFNNTNDAIYIQDKQYRFIDVNNGAIHMYGYPKEFFIGKTPEFLSAPGKNDMEKTLRYVEKAFKGKPQQFDFWGIRKNGEVFPKIVRVKKGMYKGQNVVITIGIDITERKQTEYALRSSEELYKNVFNNSPLGIFHFNTDGIITDCNDEFVRILGSTKENLVELNMIKQLKDQKIVDAIIKTLKTGSAYFNDYYTSVTGEKTTPVVIHFKAIINLKNEIIGGVGMVEDITERKKAEEEQIRSEIRFKRLFDGLGDAVFVTRVGGKDKGRILEVNTAALAQTGYSREELLGMNIIQGLSVAGSGELSADDWEEKLLKRETVTTVEKKKRKDGSEFWTEMIVTQIDFKGEKASLSINHDITNRILANKALKESEEKYRELIDTTSEGFWLLNDELKTVDVNESLCKMLGYTKEEVIGKLPSDFVDEENKKIFKNQASKITSTLHRNYDIFFTRKNGTKFPAYLSATSIVDENGNTKGSFAFVSDFTERKEAEENIFKFSRLFEDAYNEIFLFDVDSLKFTQVNKAGISNLGYSLVELQQMTPIDIKPEYSEKKFKETIEPLINGSIERLEFQTIHARKDKSTYFVEVNLQLVEFEGIRFFAAIIMDITRRKVSETKIKNALEKATESDRLKSAFLATISHELRTPLNAIIGFSDLINSDWPLEEIYGFAKTINESGTHLLSTVEEIFDITLIETGETTINKKDENLHLILRNIRKTIDNEQRKLNKESLELNLVIPFDDAHLTIYTDIAKFKQILLNLLKNALKFTHEGHINYGYSFIQQDDKKMIRFYVEDTGIGVPKDKQKLIFTTFRQVEESFSRTYGGTGIGLSISTKLTELLGGKLWIESEEGVGSTFYFTIPFPNGELENINYENVSVIEAKENEVSGDKTFLVVEDDKTSFEFLQIVLEKPGTNIIWAKDGVEAVKFCKERQEISLVLMDINMQVMDGYEATREIKKFRPQLPIIAQTAFAIAGDREKTLEAGCDDYIAKPIVIEELIKKIKKWI